MIFNKIKTACGETRVIALNTAVIGTGAAGYNAALELKKNGVTDIAIITEGVNCGTSRNTGSDKQTYYKMNLCSDYPDSPKAMALDLFNCHCVDGDIAYAEAAMSVKCFLNLAMLGVPFPVNRYGEYVGYKTDHDPRARATSAGPLTSKLMTEFLEQEAENNNIPTLDGLLVISIINDGEKATGLLCLDMNSPDDMFIVIHCANIIMATGGPAGIYNNSVYPVGHTGSSGVAFEAGVKGRNLTEWQYGLASVSPRWNVSGTYMQVLPRFVSVDSDGTEHNFLDEYYNDIGECLSNVFKKGYQWPFDSSKAFDGSSLIDLLVFREEILKKRKVYLDYMHNPGGFENLPYDRLDSEARSYLESAEACFGTPIGRLKHMNMPAYKLYLEKGVDLEKELLEISLCAQHNNGGLEIDCWWQTNIKNLFAAGEAAGSHGIYRPGGTALNAGQVGSSRAAQYISVYGNSPVKDDDSFNSGVIKLIDNNQRLCEKMLNNKDNAIPLLKKVTLAMDAAAGAIRNAEKIDALIADDRKLIEEFENTVGVADKRGLFIAYKLREALISQITYLTAMSDYIKSGGKSRGSAIYTDLCGNCADGLEDIFKFLPDDGRYNDYIQTVLYSPEKCICEFRKVRPLPEGGGFFENVWRGYRENKNTF